MKPSFGRLFKGVYLCIQRSGRSLGRAVGYRSEVRGSNPSPDQFSARPVSSGVCSQFTLLFGMEAISEDYGSRRYSLDFACGGKNSV
ncbi:hypothetical protein PoB_006608400 [Plakobranchus ocellatus]|uniref:Uncharacterized protein n=1 Tax=Plakobranchus ocellatus TaxID=259542 RepID=A0AAV4D5V2_9GAST|nr:hypothetical protein PoB_006608400 [Plakobranchus ocellatus]